MKKFLFLFMCVLFALIPLAAQDDTSSDLPTFAELEPGEWNAIEGNEETICSRGDDYRFFVRPGDSMASRVTIFFEGGGACWNGLLCGDSGPYKATVDETLPDIGSGIFDFESELNPLADDHFVFVPYCTADVFVGGNTHEYSSQVTIEHQGFTNASYAMDWMYANFEAPEQIFITGSSAGAYGAIMFAPYVMEQYPDADVVQFGDAGVGVTPVGWGPLGVWGMFDNMPPFIESLAETDPETFTINVLYAESAAAFPDQTFSQFTNVADQVQIDFYNFSTANPNDWTAEMRQKFAQLEVLDNFTYFVAPGSEHTILPSDNLYTLETDGVLFLDWFNALLDGESLGNVACDECDVE